MALPEIVQIPAHEYSRGVLAQKTISLSAEYQAVIKINGSPFVSIACSGSDLDLLATGHLITEGIIQSRSEIRNIEITESPPEINIETVTTDETLDRLFRIHSIASGCGQGKTALPDERYHRREDIPEIHAATLLTRMKEFLKKSPHHALTHGVHSAALLTTSGDFITFSDEIGRHNAVDKIIGHASREGIDISDKMIFSTGRLSSEIVNKAILARIPVLASKASPTSMGVELARKYNIVLIGRVSGGSFWVFSGRERIVI